MALSRLLHLCLISWPKAREEADREQILKVRRRARTGPSLVPPPSPALTAAPIATLGHAYSLAHLLLFLCSLSL